MNTNYGKTLKKKKKTESGWACNGGDGSVGTDESLIWAQLVRCWANK